MAQHNAHLHPSVYSCTNKAGPELRQQARLYNLSQLCQRSKGHLKAPLTTTTQSGHSHSVQGKPVMLWSCRSGRSWTHDIKQLRPKCCHGVAPSCRLMLPQCGTTMQTRHTVCLCTQRGALSYAHLTSLLICAETAGQIEHHHQQSQGSKRHRNAITTTAGLAAAAPSRDKVTHAGST